MEGVVDAPMRAFMTRLGGFTRCVTEFVRVTDVLLPPRVFYRLCPELDNDGHTDSAVPVYVQLLGSNAAALALNAQRAVALGAPGIDLNFGCPAKTVNKSMGGSIMLREPELVEEVVARVREAVPVRVPVTAKIRLGYETADHLEQIVRSIYNAGADELTIHARTKFDGYKPPAYWSLVGAIHTYPKHWITINGEIWSEHSACEAIEQSGCPHLMIGRGALSAPDLARRITHGTGTLEMMPWESVLNNLEEHFWRIDCQSPRHIGNRTKQWLAYLKRNYPQAEALFKRLRTHHHTDAFRVGFAQHRLMDIAL